MEEKLEIKTYRAPTAEEIIRAIDSTYMKELVESESKAQVVLRQVWYENEKTVKSMNGGQLPCEGIDTESIRISKEDAFGLNLTWEDMRECAAIFFIRKGVKAHYEELRKKETPEAEG